MDVTSLRPKFQQHSVAIIVSVKINTHAGHSYLRNIMSNQATLWYNEWTIYQ